MPTVRRSHPRSRTVNGTMQTKVQRRFTEKMLAAMITPLTLILATHRLPWKNMVGCTIGTRWTTKGGFVLRVGMCRLNLSGMNWCPNGEAIPSPAQCSNQRMVGATQVREPTQVDSMECPGESGRMVRGISLALATKGHGGLPLPIQVWPVTRSCGSTATG